MLKSSNEIATAVTSHVEGIALAVVRFIHDYVKLLWLVIFLPLRAGWVLLYQPEIQLPTCPALSVLCVAVFGLTSILLVCTKAGATVFDVFDSLGLTQNFSVPHALSITLPTLLVVYTCAYLASCLFSVGQARNRVFRLCLYIIAGQLSAFAIIFVAVLAVGMASSTSSWALSATGWKLILRFMTMLMWIVTLWPQLAWVVPLQYERQRKTTDRRGIERYISAGLVVSLTLIACLTALEGPLLLSQLRAHPVSTASSQPTTSTQSFSRPSQSSANP
jgi:hypothetical protein